MNCSNLTLTERSSNDETITQEPLAHLQSQGRAGGNSRRGDSHEIAQKHGIHPNQIAAWRRQLLEHASELFANGASDDKAELERRIGELHAKIGELTMERDFLSGALGRFRLPSVRR